jgi:aldehyde dehydrogenase (NAD+)
VKSSEALVTHPGIDKVAFTGSTAVGKRIAGLAGPQLKRLTLELGGKAAAIVLDDAELGSTVPQLIGVSMALSGQFCTAQSRILVSRDRYDEAVDLYAGMAASLPVGHTFDEGTFIGPLISERQRDRVLDYIEIGKQEGATLVAGGGRPAHLERGWFVEPTVFRDVKSGMRIAQEEIFGPTTVIMPVGSVEEAIAAANSTQYGLSLSVYTNDLRTAFHAINELHSGIVYINAPTIGAEIQLPFGGTRNTGNGHREAGGHVLDEFSEWKSIYVDYSGRLQRAQIDTE